VSLTLLQMVRHLDRVVRDLPLAEQAILATWAVEVRDTAMEAIGTYKFKWPKLGPAAVAKHGDTPLLDTGALRDSIEITLEPKRAIVGTNNEYAEYQELGTSRIPPRPFMGPAAIHATKVIGPAARYCLRAAFRGDGMAGSGAAELLHAVKIALEVAHEIYRSAKRGLGK
jgi:HK97 gp10 family phage protein